MKVLSIAYPLTEVSADAAGGSEQILTLLDKAMVEAGHESFVMAAEGSRVAGTLIATPSARGTLSDSIREWGRQEHKRLLKAVLKEHDIGLVHMHSLDFHHYLPPNDVPVLSTLHLPPDWYPRRIFQSKRRNFFLNCVSASERKACPPSRRLLPTIPNGIDVDHFQWRAPRGDFALALGRICPEKGFHRALQAAKGAQVEMILAGELFPYASHRTYFEKEIVPALDDRRRFIGPVGFGAKRDLLARARCLLITSTVAETSSLVAMEAMASGTPVIAFPAGALPEIIEPGRTGFLVQSVQQMAEAISYAGCIDPAECRRAAETRFSASRMANSYLRLYQQILQRARPDETTCEAGLVDYGQAADAA